jgi:hypothetical protein
MREKSALQASLIILAWIYFISCDDGVGTCYGVNLENTSCAAENVLSIGQQRGLACYYCVGNDTGDVFNISWSFVNVAGSSNPGTLFVFLNTTDRWIAEFTDCGTITLYNTTQGVTGLVKGDLSGTLEQIDPFQIDKLSLFINIPGVRTEEAICDFCADSTPPRCFNSKPYLD